MAKYTDILLGLALFLFVTCISFAIIYVILLNQKNIEMCIQDNVNNGWSTAPCYHKPNKSYVVQND